MSPWEKLLERPPARGHFVQLYEADESALIRNVGLYFWEGLKRGEGVFAIATPEHRELFCRRLNWLGADTSALVESGQLLFWDAQQTLSRVMSGGQPEWQLVESVLSPGIRRVRPASQDSGVRAYGEMVGLLCKARQYAAATRLEQLWNRLLERYPFSLYCAYAIDIFNPDSHAAELDGILSTHTHLVPAESNGNLETALGLAMHEILGDTAIALRGQIKANSKHSWAVMPNAEAIVLWLRRNLPAQAGEIVERARHHHKLMAPPGASAAEV